MKKQLIFFLFLFLVCIGISYETQVYTYGGMSGTEYGIVGLSALLSLLYIIPAFLLLDWTRKKWEIPLISVGLALLGGLFISGWLSGLANSYSSDLLKGLFSQGPLASFEDAIMAPIVEEPLKLVAVAFALYLAPIKKPKAILLLGAAAGLGFQISEDYSYILSDLPDGFSFTISGILGRAAGSISSHWLYTALAAFGLFLMWTYTKTDKKISRVGLFFFLATFVSHFAWNSPLTAIETEIDFIRPFLSALNLYLFYRAYKLADHLEQDRPLAVSTR